MCRKKVYKSSYAANKENILGSSGRERDLLAVLHLLLIPSSSVLSSSSPQSSSSIRTFMEDEKRFVQGRRPAHNYRNYSTKTDRYEKFFGYIYELWSRVEQTRCLQEPQRIYLRDIATSDTKRTNTWTISENIGETGPGLPETCRKKSHIANRQTEQPNVPVTENIEEITRCLVEPCRKMPRIANSQTEKPNTPVTKNIEEITPGLSEPCRKKPRIANRQIGQLNTPVTESIEEITRCLVEPHRKMPHIENSQTVTPNKPVTKNIKENMPGLPECPRRNHRKENSQKEQPSALIKNNINEITPSLLEPRRRNKNIVNRQTEKSNTPVTKNIKKILPGLPEPPRRNHLIANSQKEQPNVPVTKNIEEISPGLLEPRRKMPRLANSQTQQLNTPISKNIEEITRCLLEPCRLMPSIAVSNTEQTGDIWMEIPKAPLPTDILDRADLLQVLKRKCELLKKEFYNVVAPRSVQHKSDHGELCDAEDGHYEFIEELLCGGRDVSESGIPNTSHTGLSNTITEVHGRVNTSRALNILLDRNTVCNFLHLQDDRKTVSCSFINKNLPETAERFTFRPQVLSSQSFSAGSHSWDVEVWRSDHWRVGMCYPSIDRKGGVQSVIGNNKKSWCLSRSHDRYSVIHDRKETRLFGSISGHSVRISLDYESGIISFYELGISVRHLHTFTATFMEPLYVVLGVWRGCVKISGVESGGVNDADESRIW